MNMKKDFATAGIAWKEW